MFTSGDSSDVGEVVLLDAKQVSADQVHALSGFVGILGHQAVEVGPKSYIHVADGVGHGVIDSMEQVDHNREAVELFFRASGVRGESHIGCGDALGIVQGHRASAFCDLRVLDKVSSLFHIGLAVAHNGEQGEALSEHEAIASGAEVVEHLVD